MANTQTYEVTVNGETFKVVADSFGEAAEAAAMQYDSRSDINYSLSENNTTVEVIVKSPLIENQTFSIPIQCTLRPFYHQA